MTSAPDYPQTAAAWGRIEPAPRRVRGFLGDDLVFDTTAARYVWEVPHYSTHWWVRGRRSSRRRGCSTSTRTARGGPGAF